MKIVSNPAVLLLAGVLAVLLIIPACSNSSEMKTGGFPLSNLDTNVTPQQDFYQYAVGGWLKNNPIPDEYSRWGSFEKLYEENLKVLKKIMNDAAATENPEQGSVTQKVGDFYSLGMDSTTIDKLGYTPIKPYLERIDAMQNMDDFYKIVADMHLSIGNPLFNFFSGVDAKNSSTMAARLWQGGTGLPDVEYYTKQDDRSKEIRKKYVEHVTNMFKLIGEDAKTAAQNAKVVMDIETRLAKASNTRLENRDPDKTYNKMTYDELNKTAPAVNWKLYFGEMDVDAPTYFVVGQPKFIKEVGQIVKDVPLNSWKAYLKANLISNLSPFLSSDFVNENFDFYGKFLNGSKTLRPRWKRVMGATNNSMGELVGQLYVKEVFPPEAKARAKAIVDNLRESMAESIKNLDWMSEETKEKALVKLDAFGVKIGYPDKWRNYSKLEVKKDSYVENVMRATKFNTLDNLYKIGKPVDKTEWAMTPQTVNAYYSPTRNEIVFPAAILQPPFFNQDADDAINYGAMGAVIGHEITHGFDDQGRRYDAKGNISDWWTKEDADKFNKRADMLAAQYSSYTPIDTFHVDGKLTLGENIADLGGLTISFNAFKKTNEYKEGKKIDGFTPQQRFYFGWAQVWRNNIRPENLKLRLKTDVHSPGRERVIGPLSNLPDFFKAFDVKPGDQMRNSEDKIVKIW